MELEKGRSGYNSISFYTKNFKATAMRNEHGKIEVAIDEIGVLNLTERGDFIANIISYVSIGVVILLELLIIKPIIVKFNLLTFFYIFPIIFWFSYLIISIIFDFEIPNNSKMLKKNHGAEHMIYNTYRKLKRIPLVSEVKNFTRFSGSCGAIGYSSLIMSHLIAYLIYTKFTIAIPQTIMLIIGLYLFKIFPFNFIGLLVQFFTTQKPDDNNIELGIAALCALECCEINRDKVLRSLEERREME